MEACFGELRLQRYEALLPGMVDHQSSVVLLQGRDLFEQLLVACHIHIEENVLIDKVLCYLLEIVEGCAVLPLLTH